MLGHYLSLKHIKINEIVFTVNRNYKTINECRHEETKYEYNINWWEALLFFSICRTSYDQIWN